MYGDVPFAAASVAVYDVPCVPVVSEVFVLMINGGLIVNVNVRDADGGGPLVGVESKAVAVNVNVPFTVGVPEITPAGLNDRLAGNAPLETVQL